MNMGYSDPLRGEERSMNPEFAQHQMRDPGLRTMRPHIGGGMHPPHMGGGLGSMHHTMPHLRRFSGTPHFAGGGLGNPVGEVAAASQPNLYNPDPQFRQFLQLVGQQATPNARMLTAMPSGAPQFVAEGGEIDPDQDGDQDQMPAVEDVESPDDQMSPQEDQEKQIVLNAMAAMDGQSPDPEADLKAFIQAFGPRALADLQQLVEQKHQEEQGDEDDDEDDDEGEEDQEGGEGDGDEDQDKEAADDLAAAGGGLLDGHGTGQSDEIEGETPSGRPVLLSDGEYVVDAGTVAALGDGSTKAGARRLDEMRKQIRAKAYGHDKQVKPMSKGGTAVVLRLK